MSFNFFRKSTNLKIVENTASVAHPIPIPMAQPRRARIGNKTRVMALAADIGKAGQKSRLGLPKWSA
ncbi:MAG: hypothetical protein EXR08_05790 [Alphaproteobacteria bacterium]|nr:hypothetical protein [Alphaproteobacteria bacterium]